MNILVSPYGEGSFYFRSDSTLIRALTDFYMPDYIEGISAVITVEEHAPFGGLGSMVSQVVGAKCPKEVINMALPDAPVITGTSREVFDYYGLNAEGIAAKAMELM